MRLSIQKMLDMVGGEVLVAPLDPERDLRSFTWDSREVTGDTLFLALVGEQVDGHDFIGQALLAGATALIVTKTPRESILSRACEMGATIVRVADAQSALDTLARAYRRLLDIPVVAITGSSGKTTTKDIVAAVLGSGLATVATSGNRNNELGIPATVLAADPDTEALVIEMGMRGFHQLEAACSVCAPTIGLITNVGTAHMELLGSQENIARAKAELISALPSASGVAILNGEDPSTPFIQEVATTAARGIEAVTFGIGDGYTVSSDEPVFDPQGFPTFTFTLPDGARHHVSLVLQGRHNVLNALAAIAVGWKLGIEVDSLVAALGTVTLSGMRQELRTSSRGFNVLDDTYNANPDSMRAALDVLMSYAVPGRHIAVLGDMGELGDDAYTLHVELGRDVARRGVDALVAVGELAQGFVEGACAEGMDASSCMTCTTAEEALESLGSRVGEDDIVLVKASRFMGLERIVKGLID